MQTNHIFFDMNGVLHFAVFLRSDGEITALELSAAQQHLEKRGRVFLSIVVCMSSCYLDTLHVLFYTGECFHTMNAHLRVLFPYILLFSSYFLKNYLSIIIISVWLQVGANPTSSTLQTIAFYTDLPCGHAVKYYGFDFKRGHGLCSTFQLTDRGWYRCVLIKTSLRLLLQQ